MEGTAFVSGVLVTTLIWALIIGIFVERPKDQWFKNFCAYSNGEVQGDVCLVDGRTIEIPDYPRR